MGVTPHVAQKTVRAPSTAHDAPCRATRSVSSGANASKKIFGWMKTIGLLRKLRHRGGPLVGWIFTFTAAAYNLVRLRTLLAASA